MRKLEGALPRVLFIAFAAILSFGCATPEPAQAQATPIEEAAYVEIRGAEQWVTISGADRANPIILVLHGGPGNALSPFAAALFADWRDDFTIVQWDQPGAGRTFMRNGEAIASHMSVEHMARDGIEVAQYAAERLGQNKVILLAPSWGSILGVHMAHVRPDLFHAYVGQSQIVHWNANLAASYARVSELARAAEDQETLDAFAAIGPPPWDYVRAWPQFRRRQMHYQRALAAEGPLALEMAPAYAGDEERAANEAAEEFSFLHFWGIELDGPLTEVDLTALGNDFAIPFFVVHGEQDLVAMPELASSFVESIDAPQKAFVIVPGAGHETSAPLMRATHELMLERVRPLAVP
jgi:pimeloyl-ACP methyl ester carboxylesterase